jgi:hypothetical protein
MLENADLGLMTQHRVVKTLSPEQTERKAILFDILISLFERAYILVFERRPNAQQKRLWASWEDYIRFWCAREDFREALPTLLMGEDPDFAEYMREVTGGQKPLEQNLLHAENGTA